MMETRPKRTQHKNVELAWLAQFSDAGACLGQGACIRHELDHPTCLMNARAQAAGPHIQSTSDSASSDDSGQRSLYRQCSGCSGSPDAGALPEPTALSDPALALAGSASRRSVHCIYLASTLSERQSGGKMPQSTDKSACPCRDMQISWVFFGSATV